jgi:hypothetical protein
MVRELGVMSCHSVALDVGARDGAVNPRRSCGRNHLAHAAGDAANAVLAAAGYNFRRLLA